MKAMKLHEGKRTKKTKKKGRIVVIALIVIILVIAIILIAVQKIKAEKTLEGEVPTGEDTVIATDEVENEKIEIVDVSDMPQTMGGYTVIGKIVIDKLGMQSYILRKNNRRITKSSCNKILGTAHKRTTETSASQDTTLRKYLDV